jgi:hypothetical protein
MSVLLKTAEEVTERAIVPHIGEKVLETGLSTTLVKWLPWGGVVLQSGGLYKEVSRGLTYSGGISWLVKRIVYWCLLQSQGVIITARCLSFIAGVTSSIFAAGTPAAASALPLLLTGVVGSLRTLLRD